MTHRPPHRPHNLSLAHQIGYVMTTTCIGAAIELWGGHILMHMWHTPQYVVVLMQASPRGSTRTHRANTNHRGAALVQWQQILVYQYLSMLTMSTFCLIERYLCFMRLEVAQALFGALLVIERV